MKYKSEIDSLFRTIFFENWMDEEDYNNLIETIFKENNISYQSLSDDIEVGIKNGYGIETQIKLIESLFNERKY